MFGFFLAVALGGKPLLVNFVLLFPLFLESVYDFLAQRFLGILIFLVGRNALFVILRILLTFKFSEPLLRWCRFLLVLC